MSKIFPSGKAAEARAESSKSQFATSRLTISIVRILQARCRLLSPRRWSDYFGVCDLVAFFSVCHCFRLRMRRPRPAGGGGQTT